MTNRHNFTLHDQYMMEQRDTLGLKQHEQYALGSSKIEALRIKLERREAMKREATRRTIGKAIDISILVAFAVMSLAVIWLAAVGTLPVLGAIAVETAIFVMVKCVCNSFSKS